MDLGETEIYQALLDNDLSMLKKLLKEENPNTRGRDGRSYLHEAVDQGAKADLVKELLKHIDISFRDENTDTVLDVAFTYGRTEIKELILHHVSQLVLGKDARPLEDLLVRGWDVWPEDVDKMPDVIIKPDIVKFFQQLPDFMVKVEKIHTSIEENSIQDLLHSLTRHQLSMACDRIGLPPLQKATIFQRNAIVQYLVKEYPVSLTITDHMGNTALHYAACGEDSHLYNLILDGGANDQARNLHGLTPQFYKDNPGVMQLVEVQRHIKVLQNLPRYNNSFSMAAMMSAKEDNLNLKASPVQPSPRSSPTLSPATKARKEPIVKSRALVKIIPIHSHFRSDRKDNKLFEDTDLYEAIIMNNYADVRMLLKGDPNANFRSLEGWSYLHLAVAHSAQRDIIHVLLNHVDISLRDADGLTALDLAIESSAPSDIVTEIQTHILRPLLRGDVIYLRTLAVNGWVAWPVELLKSEHISDLPKSSAQFLASVSKIQDAISAFHQAAMKSDTSKVSQFLTNRQSGLTQEELMQSCDQTGIPALHKAVIFGSDRVLTLFIDTIVHAIDTCDNMERTALHYAACLNDEGRMYTTLKDAGAESSIPDLWGYTAVEYMGMPHLISIDNIQENIHKMVSMPQPSQSAHWPKWDSDLKMETSKLYEAIRADNTEEVLNLLNAGEDSSVRDNDGRSLLHAAASANASKASLEALLHKVDGGIRDVNGKTFADVLTSEGRSDHAAELAKEFVLRLTEMTKTEEGSGELEAEDASVKLQKLLLSGWDRWREAMEDPREKSEEVRSFFDKQKEIQDKVTAIHQAIRDGRSRDVKNLLDRKILVQAADQTGMLPLHKAVVYQREDIVKFILTEFKDVVNSPDNMGRSALHYAAGCKDSESSYQALKDAGADDMLKDLIGKTAQDYKEDANLILVEKVIDRLLQILGPTSQPADASTVASNIQSSDQSTSAQQSRETTSVSFQSTSTPPRPDSKGPVRMYISSEVYERKNVPPPTTVDGKYVSDNLGTALTIALAEIAEKRPWDPIEYLAHWLYKHRQNLDHTKKQEKLLDEIRNEEAYLEEEKKNKAERKEEQIRLQEEDAARQKREAEEEEKRKEQEELQKKANEAALAQKPQLPTVTEELEEDTMSKDRDEHGQTELHKLAAQQGADLIALLNMGYSLADRDDENKTARDIAEENEITENVESLDSYVTNLLEQENMDSLQQLLLDGYEKLTDVINQVSTDGLPDIVTDFVKSVPDVKEKISNVFKSIKSGVLRNVSQAIERKKLAMIKDNYGRSPLHIAVLLQQTEIITHLITNFPSTVKCRDNLNRSPLHYAMSISDDIAELLQAHGADPQAKDVKQRTPNYYKDNKAEILALKENLDSDDSSKQEDSGEAEKQGGTEKKEETTA